MGRPKLIATLCLFSSNIVLGGSCDPLQKETTQQLVMYVQKKFGLPLDLAVRDLGTIDQSCYRKIRFEAPGATGARLAMIVSADGRFLFRDVFDSSTDPTEVEAARRKRARADLEAGDAPSWGSPNAPVTAVLFSDFQCPFCKEASVVLRQVLDQEKDNLRLVFRHMPLPGHDWAELAAELTGCAGRQGDRAFWALHDFLFESQSKWSERTLAGAAMEWTRSQSQAPIDEAAFRSCVNTHSSRDAVRRDTDLASDYDVLGTPTLFINGVQIPGGIRSVEQVRTFIRQAGSETKNPAKTDVGAVAVR